LFSIGSSSSDGLLPHQPCCCHSCYSTHRTQLCVNAAAAAADACMLQLLLYLLPGHAPVQQLLQL
jgi:hypothetical protein